MHRPTPIRTMSPVRVFGVDYERCQHVDGGETYLTRYGVPIAASLDPAHWYADRQFAKRGVKLPGGTGAVYRVDVPGPRGRPIELVVKFSRFAQDVPLHIASTFPDDVPADVVANAEFNTPFEEFGEVMDLRRGRFGRADRRILTKRPLAIYCPPGGHHLRELGRNRGRFNQRLKVMRDDQAAAPDPQRVSLDAHRLYVLIFGWIKGMDAEQFHDQGLLSEAEMKGLMARCVRELRDKGFRMLDNKPRHLILRQRRDGSLLRSADGELVYALIDFELLHRTEEYENWLRASRAR